jgi:hypothetical protein
MNVSPPNPTELFEQAARTFQSALEAGMSIQRETTKWFSQALGGLGSPQDWQARQQAVMEEGFSLARKNTDAAIQMMNENAKASLDLLDKAFQARLPESDSDSDAYTRAHEAWETAMGSLRKNTEMMVHANTRVVESWTQIAKIVLGDAAAPKPQSA